MGRRSESLADNREYKVEVAAISALFKIAETIARFAEKLIQSGKERRDRIANYLQEIAECIHRISSRLQAGETPTDDCAQLGECLKDLNQVLDKILEAPTIDELKKSAEAATEARALAYARGQVQKPDEIYQALDTAVGRFRGAAARLRV